MAEELTVNLAAELLSHIDGNYNDQYDVFIGAVGNENVVDVQLEDAADPGVPARRFRFIGEELNG